MLAGLRHGKTLGTPLALVVRNRDHKNWTWGMSPWPPEGEPTGKGKEAVTLPRPGHADLAGVMKYGLSDVRDALERASARHTAAIVAAGGAAKALLREIGIEVAGSVATEHLEQKIDDARADRDTVGGIVEFAGEVSRRASAPTPRRRTASTPAWPGPHGHASVKGVEIGDGFGLAALRGSEAHDEIFREEGGYGGRRIAGGIEAGISNGDRSSCARHETAADADEAAAVGRPRDGEPAQALVERSDVAAVEALAVVAEACVAFELARAAKEKFGGDALDTSWVPGARTWSASRGRRPRPPPRDLGVHGRGKSTVGSASPRDGTAVRDLDRLIEKRHGPIPELFEEAGRGRVSPPRGGDACRGACRP